MALSPQAIHEINSLLEGISRQIWNLPLAFPKAGLHAHPEDLGLNIPSIWEEYCGAAIRSWTQILNDGGALDTTAKASLQPTSAKFRHWPLEMAFNSQRRRIPICSSILARNMATLLMADLHPVGGPEIWSGNQVSTSISSRIPVHLDEDGCPLEIQPFPQSTILLRKLAPLWEHGFHKWSQIICRGPNGRPYFMEERELHRANPSIKFPLPDALTRALDYLRALLSSKDPNHWQSLCQKLTEP